MSQHSKVKRDLLLRTAKHVLLSGNYGDEVNSTLARSCCKQAALLDVDIEQKDKHAATVSKLDQRLTAMCLKEEVHDKCTRLIKSRRGTKSIDDTGAVYKLSDRLEDRNDTFDEVNARFEELSSGSPIVDRENKYMTEIENQAECHRLNSLPCIPL